MVWVKRNTKQEKEKEGFEFDVCDGKYLKDLEQGSNIFNIKVSKYDSEGCNGFYRHEKKWKGKENVWESSDKERKDCHLHHLIFYPSILPLWASLAIQMVKNLPAMRESGFNALEKGMATHSDTLA